MESFLLVLLLSISTLTYSLPLSTKSRWIVDDHTGERVKLVGLNWAGHLAPMLPEGLDRMPLNEIAKRVNLMGFNSIRLTYATYMYTRHANLTVIQSFSNLGLDEAIDGIKMYNPQILGFTLIDAQKAVVNALGSNNVMVLLDCQVSDPIWCCNENDGNGFWGDTDFKPEEWLQALTTVATLYKNTPAVVAMSLRNELRGKGQNVNDWYRYVRIGSNTVHKANPNVLVLVSGLDYDLNLGFLKNRPLGYNIRNKLVYEVHRYAFSMGQWDKWNQKPLNPFWESVMEDIDNKTTFLIQGPNPSPLLISEFGVNMLGTNQADNYFLTCYLMYLASHDLDWNLWGLQGSYYLKLGKQDVEEDYSLFNNNWTSIRNPQMHEKFLSIQGKILDPNSKAPEYLRMYHPMSGRCIRVDAGNELHATDCYSISKWSHNGDRTAIRLVGTPFCLAAVGDDSPVILTRDCNSQHSLWRSVAKFQLGNNRENLCLHYDPYYSPKILTKKCICSRPGDSSCDQDSQTQWFTLVKSNAK